MAEAASETYLTKFHGFSPSTLRELAALVMGISGTAEADYQAALKLAMEDLEGATATMHKAVAVQPELAEAWLVLANWAEHFDQSELAAYYCTRVLDVDPDNPDALQGLAVAFYNLKRHAAALETLERFNRLYNPDGRRGPEMFKLQVELMTLIGSETGIDFTKRIGPSHASTPAGQSPRPSALRLRSGENGCPVGLDDR